MKIWKKTLALLLAFGMTASITACGGSGKKEPAGEELEAGTGWATAWENTFAATNVTAEGYYNYSMRVSENLWMDMKSNGKLLLADNKFYSEGYYTQEWDYSAQGHGAGKNESETKYYYGMKDGVLCQWFYNDATKAWDEDVVYSEVEEFGTGFFLLDKELELDMDRYEYLEWESLATYANGVYTISLAEEDETETYQFKFVGGKLYSFTSIQTGREEGAVLTVEMSFTFSYGDTKIGKLPYEEGFSEEEVPTPDEGNSEEDKPVIGEKGENVTTLERWNEILAESFAATNYVGVEIGTFNGEESSSTLYVDAGKAYMVNQASGVEGFRYRYLGEVDGVRYQWTSTDNATWSCDYDYDETALNGRYALGVLTGIPFDVFTYDAEKGVMVYSATEDGESGTVEVKVIDGKVVSFYLTVEGGGISMTRDVTVQYGGAIVGELPPVQNVGEGDVGGGVVVAPEGELPPEKK